LCKPSRIPHRRPPPPTTVTTTEGFRPFIFNKESEYGRDLSESHQIVLRYLCNERGMTFPEVWMIKWMDIATRRVVGQPWNWSMRDERCLPYLRAYSFASSHALPWMNTWASTS
jgi:hypothetical protein